MNVRTASFRDLGRIEQLHRDAVVREERTGVVPSLATEEPPVPQTALVRLWYAVGRTLSALRPTAETSTALLVAEDSRGEVVGFIQAAGVPLQPRTWHVVNLCVASEAAGHFAGPPLLTHLCNQGLERGVTRFSVRVPVDHPAVSLFVEQGFTQYATEQILYRDDSATARVVPGETPPLRPARRDDVAGIYHLYLRTTPKHVADLEGPTQKAWQASFQQGALARVGRDEMRHLVAEGPEVVAWVGIRPASHARPALLSLVCDGQDAELRERVLDAALAQLPPGPVSCVLRHYDSELIRALQRRGFEVFGAQLLLVRDLALKVRLRQVAADRKKKPVLAHAGLARGLVVPVDVPAHHLRRRIPSSPR